MDWNLDPGYVAIFLFSISGFKVQNQKHAIDQVWFFFHLNQNISLKDAYYFTNMKYEDEVYNQYPSLQ